MKLRKALCMAALSAAVALAGVPQGAAAFVYAKETQAVGFDEVLRQMYTFYQSKDFAAMYILDSDAATKACVEQIKANGSDRYAIDLDNGQKAMLYVAPNGDGYWWYFGAMENNLRQGQGTTIAFTSDSQLIFTGTYAADMPNGAGTYTANWNNGAGYDISGVFQGAYLNGSYHVDTHWIDDSCKQPSSDSLTITYTDNHFQSISDSEYVFEGIEVLEDEEEYIVGFYSAQEGWSPLFYIPIGSELLAVGFDTSETYSCYCFWINTEVNNGLSILRGNSDISATVPAPSATVPTPSATPTSETPAPAPETPAPTLETSPVVTTNTYIVQRGDNLSKIAQKVYGDKKYWKNIYEANKTAIKKDYIIWSNQVLTIPAL